MSGLTAQQDDGGVRFAVRVETRASRNAVRGVHGGALKVAVTAPPVGGEANAAVCRLIAKELGVAKGAVRIVRGERSRDKTVRVAGMDPGRLPW